MDFYHPEINSLPFKILVDFVILVSLDTENGLALLTKLNVLLVHLCCLFVVQVSAIVDVNEFVNHVV